MNEKLKEIERTFIEERDINLGKQCKGEYIVYNFYNLSKDNSTVKRMSKEHYTDSTLNQCTKTSKRTLLNKPLREVIDNDIYELLLRGYDLVNIEEMQVKAEENMCVNEESCKRNLVPTDNYSERFGKIFICKTCKKYYVKFGKNIFEVEYIKKENRWRMTY